MPTVTREMIGAGIRGAVLLLLLVVALSVCATDDGSWRLHGEELDPCCALAGCGTLMTTSASAGGVAIGVRLHPVGIAALRFQSHRPILPPPELAALQAV